MPDDQDLEQPSHYTTWEPSTVFDRFCYTFYAAGSRVGELGLVIASGLFLLVQLGMVGLGLLFRPVVAVLTVVSIIPAFVDAIYVWTADEVTQKEPWLLVLGTFFLAVVLAAIPVAVNTALLTVFSGTVGMAVFFFLVVGPVEETAKLMAVRLGAYRSDRFGAVIDGTVYGAFAGLGFATMENAIYLSGVSVFITPGGEATVAGTVARAGMAPGHVLFSALAGYYLGLAKFNEEYRGTLMLKGILIAALLHGALNTAIWVLAPDGSLGAVVGVFLANGLATGLELLEPWRLLMLVAIVGIYGITAVILVSKVRRYNDAVRQAAG